VGPDSPEAAERSDEGQVALAGYGPPVVRDSEAVRLRGLVYLDHRFVAVAVADHV
jgi:hypothetical protein